MVEVRVVTNSNDPIPNKDANSTTELSRTNRHLKESDFI
jgi:hypothetical protein